MRHFSQNPKWLLWLAPFRALSISAAYLTPFFIENGLNQTDIFLLQSFFSMIVVFWEVPSGWVADKFGRAFSIKVSAPIASVAMIGYGLSHSIFLFLVGEFMLAIANGLISGADDALLIDSLKAEVKGPDYVEKRFISISRRIDALGFAATALGVPIAFFVVSKFGLSATLLVDGIFTSIGMYFSFKLVEAPGFELKKMSEIGEICRQFALDVKVAGRLLAVTRTRTVLLLLASMNACTYFGFWVGALYYSAAGIQIKYFAVLLALRSAFKFYLSHRFHKRGVGRKAFCIYILLGSLTYFGMATLSIWFIPLVLGHDIVQSLAFAPLNAKLNKRFSDEMRATMNSAVNMVRRVVFAVMGPIVGLMLDTSGLRLTLLVLAVWFLIVPAVILRSVFRAGEM